MAEKTITGDAQAKDFPYAFTTVAELHKALGAPETLAEINKWLARSESTYSMVIENSIAGNTTRSLSTKVNGKHTVAPKQIFRDWAHPFLDKNGMRILEFSQEFQARQLVDEGTQELSQVWLARTGGIEMARKI